jgi:hypothetical protein
LSRGGGEETKGKDLPRHFLHCGPVDHLQAEGMADPLGFFHHCGEKLKKTGPIPLIFKEPVPKVARQDDFTHRPFMYSPLANKRLYFPHVRTLLVNIQQ